MTFPPSAYEEKCWRVARALGAAFAANHQRGGAGMYEAESRAAAAEIDGLRPCPCCGSREAPRSGVQSAISWGVQCESFAGGCGLQIEVAIDPRTPDEALAEGVLRWNRRTEPPDVPAVRPTL